MKYLLSIFILLSLIQIEAPAQKVATATMRVTATIISGATLNNIEAIDLDLERNTESSRVFKFTAPKNIETDVSTKNSIIAINEYGDKLKLSSSSIHESENGTHFVDLNTKVKTPDQIILRGFYKGNIIASINYL